jgi:hypothetical protein
MDCDTVKPTAVLIWARVTAEFALAEAKPPCVVALVQATGRGEPEAVGDGADGRSAADDDDCDEVAGPGAAGAAEPPQPASIGAASNPKRLTPAAKARRDRQALLLLRLFGAFPGAAAGQTPGARCAGRGLAATLAVSRSNPSIMNRLFLVVNELGLRLGAISAI